MARLHLMKFVFVALLCFSATTACAAEKLRYLFLIELSPQMAPRQIATAQTVHDIVGSGFEGEIKDGEKFALYFYGSRLQTNRPFTWRKGYETEYARQAANLFSGRIYTRLRPPDETLADAAAHVEVSPEITIFVFTDGSIPITGTPFDAKLNEAILRQRALFARADKPIVVTFVARNQTLVDGRVHTEVNAPFLIPETDREDETMAKALAAVRNAAAVPPSDPTDKARATLRDALVANTNTPIPVKELQFSPVLKDPPVETKAEPPVVVPTPPVEKKETPPPVEEVKPKAVEVAVATPAPVQKQPEPEPKPIVREEPKAQPATPAPAPTPKPEVKPAVIESKPVVIEQKPPVKEESKLIVKEEIRPTPKPPVVAPPVAEKTVTNAVVTKQEVSRTSAPPKRKSFPWPALFGGLVAIAIGGAIAVVRVKQRAKSPGSIITQALPHIHRKPPQ